MNTLNNNRWKPVLLALLIALTISFSSSYNLEGSGSSSNPYKIDTCGDLQAIQNDLDANYTLESDVDCYMTEKWNNGEGFKPIGGTFTGTLYGNGHTISNVYIDNVTSGPEAIFSSMDGEVRNLTINSSTVKGGGSPFSVTGTLVGSLGGTINYVTVEDSYVKAEKRRTGGIVAAVGENGEVLNSRVESSKIKATPNGGYQVGGIAGWSRAPGSKIVNSSVDANTTVIGDEEVGGLLGKNAWYTRVENSYSLARVEGGSSSAGGLIGSLGSSGEQEVINSYAAGNVTSSSGGGLIGEDNSGSETVENSYWDINATGQETSANGTGLNTTEMYNKTNYNNWDFQKQWAINPGNNYPVLMNGEGTSENPFKLSTCRQLEAVSNNLTAHYVLTSDIDCSMTENWHDGKGFDPIDDHSNKFNGTFNGDDHKIEDLYINRPSTDNIGLFGYTTSNAEITDLDLVNASVDGNNYVGLIDGTSNAKILNVEVNGNVQGYRFIGGIVGRAKTSTDIRYSRANVKINGDEILGSVVGKLKPDAKVVASYGKGKVSGDNKVGGLIGTHEGSVVRSYSTANVTGSATDKGGLIGYQPGGSVSNSYWDVNTTNQSSSAGGTGLNTSEMKNSSNFQNWDFKYTWGIDEGRTYPFFTPGNGTEQNPFKISNVDQLQEMENNLTAHYELVDDIDASNTSEWNSGKGFEGVGSIGDKFKGKLQGNNHVIRGLYIDRDKRREGLFSATNSEAVIENLGVTNVDITSSRLAAAIAGYHAGLLNNTFSSGDIEITDARRAGGLVASMPRDSGALERSYSVADISGSDELGGLVGKTTRRGEGISKSFSKGDLDGKNNIGGLSGYVDGAIEESYSTGEVFPKASNGLVGYVNVGSVTDGYWDVNTSGVRSGQGTGLYTSQLKNNKSLNGFDFQNTWAVGTKNEGYPYLQNVPMVPQIYDYRVERLSDNDANISFKVGQELEDIKVEVHGPTTANITEENFTSKYNSTVYWAEVNGSSTGEYNATIRKAVSGANGLDGADEEFEETLCDQGTRDTDCKVQNHKTVEEMPYQAEEINISGNMTIESGGKLEYDKNTDSFELDAANIEIQDGGEIRGNVNITTDNLTVEEGGKINVSRLGYGKGPANNQFAPGPGGAKACKGDGGGASYGGKGGYAGDNNRCDVNTQPTYGSFSTPRSFGSAGGSKGGPEAQGMGGGRIIVDVESVEVEGDLLANGGPGSNCGGNTAGGGSGGSILLNSTNSIDGSGVVSAQGSESCGDASGGGGGRIAFKTSQNLFSGEVSVQRGPGPGSYDGDNPGNPGTIYPRNTICDSGNLSTECTLTEVHENSIKNFTGTNLTVTSGAALKTGQNLTLNFSHIEIEEDANITATKHMEVNAESMDVKGNIDVTSRPDPDYSDTNRYLDLNVSDLDVSGGLRANVNVSSDNFTLAENGWLNASGLGYNGPTTLNGVSGPGGGIWERNENNNVGAGSGAGYGGKGGLQQRAAKPGLAGGKYGSLRLPYSFGSAGAPSWGDKGNNDGGGRLIVTSKYAKLEGSFSANGRDAYPSCWTSGGGAGGSILINISSTLGGFSLYSTGGNSQTECLERGGGGAGGRVAVYTDSDPSKYSLSINVSGGSGYEDGGDGTVRTPLDVSLDKTTVKDGEDLEINGGLATDVDGVLKGHPLQVWLDGNRRNLSDWGSGAPNLSLAEGLNIREHAGFSDFDQDGRMETVYLPEAFSGDGNDVVREWNGSEWVQNDSQDEGLKDGVDTRFGVDPALHDFDNDGEMNVLLATVDDEDIYSKEWNGTHWKDKSGLVDNLNSNYLTSGNAKAVIEIADLDDDNRAEMLYDSNTGSFDSGMGFQWNGSGWEKNSSLMNGIDTDLGDSNNGEKGFDIEDFDGDGSYELFNPTSSGVYAYRWNGSHWNSVDVARGLDRISSVGGTNIVDFGENGRVEAIVPSNPEYAVTWRQPFTNSSGEFSYSFTPKKAGNISLKFNSSNGTKVAGEGTEYYVKDELTLENNQSQFVSEGDNYIDVDETDSNTEVNLSTRVYENVDSQIDWVKADVTSPEGNQETFTLCQNVGDTQTCSQKVNLEDLDDSSVVEKGRYNVTYRARSSLDGSNIFEGRDYNSSFYVQNVSMPLEKASVVDPGEVLELNGTVYSEPSNTFIRDRGVEVWLGDEKVSEGYWSRNETLERGFPDQIGLFEEAYPQAAEFDNDDYGEVFFTNRYRDRLWEWNGTAWNRNTNKETGLNTQNQEGAAVSGVKVAVGNIDSDERTEAITVVDNVPLGNEWTGDEWVEDERVEVGLSSSDQLDLFDIDQDGKIEMLDQSQASYSWDDYWRPNSTFTNGLPSRWFSIHDLKSMGQTYALVSDGGGGTDAYRWDGNTWQLDENVSDGIADVGGGSQSAIIDFNNDFKDEAIIADGGAKKPYVFQYNYPVADGQGEWQWEFQAPERAGTYDLKINTTDRNGIYGENSTTFNVTLPIQKESAEFEASNNSHIDVDGSNQNVNLSAFVGNSSDSDVDMAWAEVESPAGSTETFYLDSTEAKSNSQTWFKSVDVSSYFTNNGHTTLGRYNISFYANTTRGIGSEVKNTSFYVENVSIEAELGDSRVNLNEELNVSGDVELRPYGDSIGPNPVNLMIENSTWNRSIQQSEVISWKTASDWEESSSSEGVEHKVYGNYGNMSVEMGLNLNESYGGDLASWFTMDEIDSRDTDDDGQAEKIIDRAGISNATLEGSIANDLRYRKKGAVSFSGDDRLNFGNTHTTDNWEGITWAALIDPAYVGDPDQSIFGKAYFGSFYFDNGQYIANWRGDDGSSRGMNGGTANPEDRAYWAISTYNGTHGALYVNDTKVDSFQESFDIRFRESSNWLIGNNLNGWIREAAMWKKGLTPDQVEDLFKSSTRGDLVTSYESVNEKTTELHLRDLDYSLNNGSINVTVQSDFDSDGTVEENASEVSLDGGESFEVSGISEESDRFRLFIELESDNVTKSPVFSGVELVAGEVSNSSGIYEKSFEAPPEPGNYTVEVNSTDENGVYGVNETTLSVFNLTARIDDYPDTVFKDADDTEDYTIYDTLISDPENPGTLEDIYYSFYDPQNWDIEYQVGQNSFNQDFTTVTSLAPGDTYSMNASIDIGENAELGPQEVILNASSSDKIFNETSLSGGRRIEVWTRSEADFVAPDVRSPIPRNNTYWQANAEIYDEYESSGGPRGGTLEDVNTTFGLYQVTDTGDQLKTRKYVDSDSNGVAEFNWSLNRFGVGEYYVRAITNDEPGLYVNSTNAPVFTQSFNVSGIFIRDSSLQNYDSIYRENGSSPDDGGFQATFSNSLDNYVENANISWSFPDQELNTTTDSNGFARVVYNPSTSVTPGNYSVEIDAEKKNYEPFGFNQSVVVRGKLNVTNEYTEGTRRPLTRGLETVLNSSVVDEYSSGVSADVNWSINGTVIDSGIDTIDLTNESISRGNATLWANASEKYYDSDQDSEKVKVYGLAEVSELYPPDTDILPGTTINVTANVTDAVTNETVKDMPVTFYENGTEIGSSLTNSSGVAKIQWSPSDGYKNLTAEIKDNSSILYNVSDYNTSSMVEIDRELYIEEYSFSERTIFRPNTLEPYISDLDVEVTETDTDSSRKPASGKTIYAEVNDSDTFSCVTDSTGSCTISIEPGQSIDPGNDTVEIISNTTGYQSDFKQDWLIVKGSFTTFDGQHEIVEPASGEATRGESLNIEFAMKNSFGETVDLPVNWKFAGRNITDTAKDTSFTVGVEESLGSQTLSADVISPYYYEGADSDSVSIDVYGKSNVKLERPSNDTTVGYGESPEVLCSVDDQNGDAINSYPVRFFQNETTLKNTTTDIRGEATAEWEVPNRIEEYEVGCEISDNASKYFRADTGVSSKLYETNDDVPPTVGNLSLNVTELKPGESVFVNYTASDQVGVDDTYIEITDPIFSTTRIEPSNVSGTFEAVFTPQKTGSYTVEAFANDTNGNLGSDTVNFQTAQSATVSLDPSDFSAGDVQINQNQTYSTDVTVDAENDVEYLNLSFNVSNDYEPLVDYNSSALSCGNLSSGESCSKTMSVTVEEGVPPQTAFIQYVADYYANGTERSVRAVQTLSVQENPVITPDPGELFNNGAGGGLTPANNSYNNTVDVENVGNYEVLEFGTSFSSSNISQDQIEFYGGQVREIPSSSSQAERTQEVTAEFTAPYGLSPGNYSANISFQGEQTSGKTEVTYLIDDFVDLRAGPKGEESTLVVGQQQKIGEVEIKSLANTRIDVVPSVDSGLSTNSIETNLQGLPNNIQLDPLENDTFAVMTDSDGIPTTVDDASLVIDFEVPADGLTVQQGATFNIQVANLSLNFLSNTSTEDVDIKQASQDSVQVEYSKAGSASTQNVSFDVFLRNSSRNISKEANILGRASQDGEFTLDFSYPSAEDARVYDLVIETTDQELGVSFNTTVKKKYRYIDVTKPVYKSVKVEDVFKDEKVDVNVSVSDNNLKPVRNVSYQVEFPSDSKRFYLNKTGGYWTGRFSPPNSTGDYLGTFRTTDNAFNNASFEKYFRVGEKKNFTGRFEDSGGNPVSASINLTDPESGNLISSFDILESSQYSFDVKSGRYDVVVNTQGSRVVLNNADVTKDDPIKINSLSGSEAPSPASKGKLMGIAVKQNMDPSSGEIMFNYSQYESNIPSDESISDVEIGRCEQFNYTNIECNGNWTKLNRTAFTTNVNQKTVTASVPGFSIYTLYFPEETNEELQEIRDEVEQTQRSLGGISRNISDLRNGSGQGGGSGGSGLSLGSNSISASIKPGETKRASLLLQNQDETDREYSFSSSEAISRFLSLPDEQDLSGEESTEAIIEISAPSDATPSSYSGYITIESDESQRQLPVNIEILPPESELLDLSIEPVFDSIRPGSNAQVEATLNNQGYTRNVDVTLNLEVVNPDTNQTLATKETTLAVSTTLTRVVNIQIPEDAKLRSYEVRGTARYSNLDVPQVATSIATLEVSQPFWGRTVLGVTYGTMVIGFVAMLITAIAAAGIYQYHRKQVLKKKRYMEQIDLDTIPSGGQRKAYVGKLAEMGTRTFIDLDDLTTHALIAGATGSGKTVTGQIMVEEALEEGVNVIVLDPTAQWSGYLRECDEDEMIELYSEFGMSESDARTFNGNIRAVEPEQPEVDIGQYLESEEKEGRIIVFSMHKLDNENLEKFVDSTIQQVFDANLPERNHLETMLVYDEAHRILDKFGGSGEGVEQLERGAREFRKWGVGMLLLSQVVSDFPGEVRANVGTTVQMRTQYEGDLDRIKEKFGMDTVQSVAKAEVGSGMVQNSDYNHGRPYFVNFRPMLHSPHRLSDEQLDTYEDYNRRMDQLEKDIDELEEQGQEVYEYRNQLKLARKNLRKGSFNLVDIYIEELEEDLE